MSIGEVSSIGSRPMPQQVQPAVQAGGDAGLAGSAAGSTAAGSASSTAATQSTSISATSASQSISYTSASSQATSFFGTQQPGSFEEQVMRLVVMLMLLDELLKGERGDNQTLAALGMAMGLGGGNQSMSAMSYSSSYESLSISQQSSSFSSTSVGSANVTAAYGGTLDGSGGGDAGASDQIDVSA